MTGPDVFDLDFEQWLDDRAGAPIPTTSRDHALLAIAGRRPRPAHLARLGSHWSPDPANASPATTWRTERPVFRSLSGILLLLLALALVGTAVLIGSRVVDRPPEPWRLAFERDGAIYLADPDGTSPVQVAPDVSVGANDAGPVGLASESIWAPDGKHFLFFEGGARSSARISDPDGRVVASFPNFPGFNGFPSWSPDSTQLQAWTDDFSRISIYGIDGVLQTSLMLPGFYSRFRENRGVWAPDGRSVWVLLSREDRTGGREAWALPVDGSAPRQVDASLPFVTFDLAFTSDGTRMAFMGTGDLLYVANPDGTDLRPVVRTDADNADGTGVSPVWSPNGRQIAYFVWAPGDDNRIDLKVVDVATGTARTLVSGFQYAAWPPFSWSPEGDKILFSKQDGPGRGSLWTVGAGGGDAALLVEGASVGEWQPAPRPATPEPTPAPAPTAALSSNAPSRADYAIHMVAALDELQRAQDGDEDIASYLENEKAWVMDRLPASRKDDPAIAAYVDAVQVLRVSPITPEWEERWAAYFATRPALAALAPGRILTPPARVPGPTPPR